MSQEGTPESDTHNPGDELHPPPRHPPHRPPPPTAPHPPPPKTREEGFDLPYLSVIAPRSELQVTAQGSPGDPPTLLVRGLVHRSQPQEKSA